MGLFDNALGEDQTLFKNDAALDYDYVPKILPYRENEQQYLATCIKPLFASRSGRNLFIYGAPGIGKTAATKYVLRELEEKTDKISTVYINCWQQNTSYKVLTTICERLGYKFTQNKKTADLMDIVADILDEAPAVFVFDEIDKSEDQDFLYFILEHVPKKSVFLITNYKSWLASLDTRIKSRLVPEMVEFDAYSHDETKGILENRMEYAFYDGVWTQESLHKVVRKATELQDIRSGLFLLKEAALQAEDQAKKTVEPEHIDDAIRKLDEFTIKNSAELSQDLQDIYAVVKENSGNKIGDLYDVFKDQGATVSYKTFQRKIGKLEEAGFIKTTKKTGAGGNTTIIERAFEDIETQ